MQNEKSCPVIALVGDRSDKIVAHRAIPFALEMAVAATECKVRWRWIDTAQIKTAPKDLGDCAALWVLPGSPYANVAGVFDAIRWARETDRPFLGTCGGFQHALIEFARNVSGLGKADHAETSPEADLLLINRLSCSLVENAAQVRFAPESRLRRAYGSDTAVQEYHCNYGFNPSYRPALEEAGLRFTAFDQAGEIRAFELPTHPFFVGTLFQPERAVLRKRPAPLVNDFVREVHRTTSTPLPPTG